MSAGKYQRVRRKRQISSLLATSCLSICLASMLVLVCLRVRCRKASAYEILRWQPVCITHSNHTSVFAIISAIALYMSSAAHRAYTDLTTCLLPLITTKTQGGRERERERGILVPPYSCCENDRKVKSTLTNAAITPQKATTWQASRIWEREQVLLSLPLSPTLCNLQKLIFPSQGPRVFSC